MTKRIVDARHPRNETSNVVEPSSQGPTLLVVDDDPKLLFALQLHLGPLRPVRAVDNYAAAMKAIDDGEAFCGAIVDVKLDDGRDGLDIVARVRKKLPHIPVLVLTGDPTPEVLSRAFPLGVQVLPKAFASPHLTGFAVRCIVAEPEDDPAVLAALGTYARDHDLTAAEIEVVHGALHDRRIDTFVARGMARSTYKSRVNAVLEKTGGPTLNDVSLVICRLAVRLARESWAF